MTDFDTLEDMIEFYEANKGEYELTFGECATLYHKTPEGNIGEVVATVDDARAPAFALNRLKGMITGVQW